MAKKKEQVSTLEEEVNDIIKSFSRKKKKPIIAKASEFEYVKTKRRIPTGSFGLDLKTGGGWLVGACNEIHGKKGVGKSTEVYITGIHAILEGYAWLHADLENSMDLNHLYKMAAYYGLSKEILDANFYLVNAKDGMILMDVARKFASSGRQILFSADTITGIEPEALLKMSHTDDQRGVKARKMAEFLRRLQVDLVKEPDEVPTFCFLWVAHEGDNFKTGGSDIMGGNQMQYQKQIEVHFKKGRQTQSTHGEECPFAVLKPDGEPLSVDDRYKRNMTGTGRRVRYDVNKNKTFPDGLWGYFDFYYSHVNLPGLEVGCIDRVKEVVDIGTHYNIISKAGSWYTYKDIKAQGSSNFANALRELFVDYREKKLNNADYKNTEYYKLEKVITDFFNEHTGEIKDKEYVENWLSEYEKRNQKTQEKTKGKDEDKKSVKKGA